MAALKTAREMETATLVRLVLSTLIFHGCFLQILFSLEVDPCAGTQRVGVEVAMDVAYLTRISCSVSVLIREMALCLAGRSVFSMPHFFVHLVWIYSLEDIDLAVCYLLFPKTAAGTFAHHD